MKDNHCSVSIKLKDVYLLVDLLYYTEKLLRQTESVSNCTYIIYLKEPLIGLIVESVREFDLFKFLTTNFKLHNQDASFILIYTFTESSNNLEANSTNTIFLQNVSSRAMKH